ncbi:MAG: DNA-processing protein DprA [Phycisphaerae bacterium]|nr:DNA-processing protein DprA [Phycisphaerae bacterium]
MDDDQGWTREREAMLALALCDGLGAIGIGRLIAMSGSATAAIEGTATAWAAALGCAVARAERLRSRVFLPAARDELAAGAALDASLVVRGEPRYPVLLAAIPDPPPTLWLRGVLQQDDAWAVAVVGSRRASAYGIDQAGRFSTALVERGHAVVSGGARGIDAEAHRAALRAGGRTIAVLGSGLARPYPPEHARLFDEIVAGGGAILSEFPVTMSPRPELFPRRNRIVSGMSIGVLVIEARRRSGASITARLAVEDQGREAMALPGRVDSAASEGCHIAIREGWAALVASPQDVFDQLASARHLVAGASELASAPEPPLSDVARRIAARLVDAGPLSLDELCAIGLSAGVVLAEITMLELKRLVERDTQGRYQARPELRAAVAGKRSK